MPSLHVPIWCLKLHIYPQGHQAWNYHGGMLLGRGVVGQRDAACLDVGHVRLQAVLPLSVYITSAIQHKLPPPTGKSGAEVAEWRRSRHPVPCMILWW